MAKLSKKESFLAAYEVTCSITRAAKAARIERSIHYRWLADDPAYAAKFEAATDRAAQTLEDEAVRRAHEGVDEPIVYQGALCYPWREKINPETGEVTQVKGKKHLAITRYSDGLMQFLLRGLRRDKYRESSKVEHTGPGGAPMSVSVVFVKPE